MTEDPPTVPLVRVPAVLHVCTVHHMATLWRGGGALNACSHTHLSYDFQNRNYLTVFITLIADGSVSTVRGVLQHDNDD